MDQDNFIELPFDVDLCFDTDKNRTGNPRELENSDTDSASETEHDPQIIIGNENEHTLSKDGTEIESNSDITNIMRS